MKIWKLQKSLKLWDCLKHEIVRQHTCDAIAFYPTQMNYLNFVLENSSCSQS